LSSFSVILFGAGEKLEMLMTWLSLVITHDVPVFLGHNIQLHASFVNAVLVSTLIPPVECRVFNSSCLEVFQPENNNVVSVLV
jgi:hypothetical protein